MAASLPVVIASDQSAVPVSAAALPLPTGAATLAEQQTQTTALQILDNIVSGNEAQVDVVASLPAGEAHIGEVGGNAIQVAVEFARPANTTAYAVGDVVSNDETTTTLMTFANFSRVNAGSGYIVGAKLVTDKKSITPRLRVHLYNVINPTVSGDNVAAQMKYADEGKYLGYIDLPSLVTFADTTNSDASHAVNFDIRIPYAAAAATRSIFAWLETLDVFGPASGQKFTLRLYADNN
jgi:hypothetical protein